MGDEEDDDGNCCPERLCCWIPRPRYHFSSHPISYFIRSPNPYGSFNVKPPISFVPKLCRRLISEPTKPPMVEFVQVLSSLNQVLSLYREMGLDLFTLYVVVNSCCHLRNLFGVNFTVGFVDDLIMGYLWEIRNVDALRLFRRLIQSCRADVLGMVIGLLKDMNVLGYYPVIAIHIALMDGSKSIVRAGVCKMGNMCRAVVLIPIALIDGLCKNGRRVDVTFDFGG